MIRSGNPCTVGCACTTIGTRASALSGCKSGRSGEQGKSLGTFPVPPVPQLRPIVELALELQRVSNSVERPKIDEELLDRERSYHSLDSPLPAILLYFGPGDAIMACFDNECEFWGQETSEPNLIVPVRPSDPDNVREAFIVLRTLLRPWWTPAASRPMFFRAGSELSELSGHRFPHPALLFVVCNEASGTVSAHFGDKLRNI
jgi:hypothetical protein